MVSTAGRHQFPRERESIAEEDGCPACRTPHHPALNPGVPIATTAIWRAPPTTRKSCRGVNHFCRWSTIEAVKIDGMGRHHRSHPSCCRGQRRCSQRIINETVRQHATDAQPTANPTAIRAGGIMCATGMSPPESEHQQEYPAQPQDTPLQPPLHILVVGVVVVLRP